MKPLPGPKVAAFNETPLARSLSDRRSQTDSVAANVEVAGVVSSCCPQLRVLAAAVAVAAVAVAAVAAVAVLLRRPQSGVSAV